ncbi:MAG: hypothetical protein CM15mP106_4420 [Candidatus Neomarinimicrobiota bacterium]|nr:MAG: hypothetical protein CM15mP106_4420 [Candidatus Neomarinimicrobiota bacterium]
MLFLKTKNYLEWKKVKNIPFSKKKHWGKHKNPFFCFSRTFNLWGKLMKSILILFDNLLTFNLGTNNSCNIQLVSRF